MGGPSQPRNEPPPVGRPFGVDDVALRGESEQRALARAALRDQLGDRVAILVPDGFAPVPLLIDQAGSAATGVFLSLAGIAGADQLRQEGRRFAQTFSATLAGERLEPSAIYAAQAMEVVLDAIRRSDGTRASVLRALFETRIPNGLLGSVSSTATATSRQAP